MHSIAQLPSSYRDPSGCMFEKEGVLYRQVNLIFKKDFDHFIQSGCYAHLVEKGWLVQHREIEGLHFQETSHYKTIQPDVIPFISYPYEWCFDMLRDAALLTLQLMSACLPFGVILKDASPYNIQWQQGRPVFIDTLSFERYDPDQPWIAYRQFCECFLSPLLLMQYTKQPLQPLLLAFPDGIPLSTTAALLPARSQFSLPVYLHMHLHSSLAGRIQKNNNKTKPFSRKKLEHLVTSLASMLHALNLKSKTSTWENYYDEAAQRKEYVIFKKKIIEKWIAERPVITTAIDIGANTGEFSLHIAAQNICTIATDADHASINRLYLKIKQERIKNILPLVIDISNPSPSIGLNNLERISFLERSATTLVLALALLHHLCIGKNIPFENLARLFQKMSKLLIIEFIPKDDQKIQLMLQHKKDNYHWYSRENFVRIFSTYYNIIDEKEVGSSKRILFVMQAHE